MVAVKCHGFSLVALSSLTHATDLCLDIVSPAWTDFPKSRALPTLSTVDYTKWRSVFTVTTVFNRDQTGMEAREYYGISILIPLWGKICTQDEDEKIRQGQNISQKRHKMQ